MDYNELNLLMWRYHLKNEYMYVLDNFLEWSASIVYL